MTVVRAAYIDPERYRAKPGGSAVDYATEQDVAAGGREARFVVREDGTQAAASVALRCYQAKRRVYAYLRWAEGGSTREKYLGDVSDYPDRESALRAAWHRVETSNFRNSTDTTAQRGETR